MFHLGNWKTETGVGVVVGEVVGAGVCFDNKVKHKNKISSKLLQEPKDRKK